MKRLDPIGFRMRWFAGCSLVNQCLTLFSSPGFQCKRCTGGNIKPSLMRVLPKGSTRLRAGPSRKHIFEIAADWRGICEVRLDLPAEGDLNPDSWGELDLLCREFVANAVRSGKASVVTICVISAPTQIQVDIMDNGSGFASGPAGLGTTWLTQLSGGSWSLIPSESGAHISITLSK